MCWYRWTTQSHASTLFPFPALRWNIKSNMGKHLLKHHIEIDKNVLTALFLFPKISFDSLFKVPEQCKLPVSDLISAPIGPD